MGDPSAGRPWAPTNPLDLAIKTCCQDAAHLERIEHVGDHHEIYRCRVCGCRHIRAFVSGLAFTPRVPITGGDPGA